MCPTGLNLFCHLCREGANVPRRWKILIYGKITPPIYHSIKSSHVQWPVSQVATCDQRGVTAARRWQKWCHILVSVTSLWSQVATCDTGHCTCDDFYCVILEGSLNNEHRFFCTILCSEFITKVPISDFLQIANLCHSTDPRYRDSIQTKFWWNKDYKLLLKTYGEIFIERAHD